MNPYFEQAVLNADPVELVRLLHQKAIASVRDAREHLKHKKIAERSRSIGEAYAALAELFSSLRPEVAPELAGRLQSLYLYMQRLLIQANFAQADPPLAEVLALLKTLVEGWTEVSLQTSAERRSGSPRSAQPSGYESAGYESPGREARDAVMA